MNLDTVEFGDLVVSRMIIGGNPFSGFSHQGEERDEEMMRFYKAENIKMTFKKAEEAGINTHIGRADHHVMRVLMEYWDDGGDIQWIAQTCPELGSPTRAIQNAISGGAKACYIHGGQMDYYVAQKQYDEVYKSIDMIRDAGLTCGVAGHNTGVFEWADENIDVDFYMCSYYNPTDRTADASHVHGADEKFHKDDRDAMVATIADLSKPVIHYKVMAAGRTPADEALDFVARNLRENDAVALGIYLGDNRNMITEDIDLLCTAMGKYSK